MRISYTSLDTFKSCPLKFKYQEIDKIRVPKTLELVFGSAIHSALQYMFERSPLYPTLDQIIDFFRNSWQEQSAAFKEKELEEQKKMYFDDGVKILERFYKKNKPWNANNLELESFFSIDLQDQETNETHTLTGKIDRIDKDPETDVYEIIDYKTSKRMPSQSIVDNDLQLSVYNLGIIKKWPHLSPDKIKLSLYYVRHGEKLETKRSGEDIEKTKQFVLNSVREIEERKKKDDFPAYPSALCDWCGYKQMCPMWRHLYESEKLKDKNEKDIEFIVKEYFELKNKNESNDERLNELKALIFGFMDEQKVERVFGKEGYLTRKMQERVSYDMKKIKDVLKGKIDEFLIKSKFVTLSASKKKADSKNEES